jgi:hypothetical protein
MSFGFTAGYPSYQVNSRLPLSRERTNTPRTVMFGTP